MQLTEVEVQTETLPRRGAHREWPSRKTLERYAKATGTRPVIKLVAAG
jgi:hypothetical protein